MRNVWYRIGVGIHLIRIARDSYGTDRFWDVIGWWHGEIHYTIPRIEEERRVAAELERAFMENPDLFGVRTLTMPSNSYVSFSSSIPSRDSNLIVSDGQLVIDPPGPSIGQWQWQGVAVRAGNRPNLIRRLLINALTGAEWVPDNKKAQVSPGPEYDRLAEFISPS